MNRSQDDMQGASQAPGSESEAATGPDNRANQQPRYAVLIRTWAVAVLAYVIYVVASHVRPPVAADVRAGEPILVYSLEDRTGMDLLAGRTEAAYAFVNPRCPACIDDLDKILNRLSALSDQHGLIASGEREAIFFRGLSGSVPIYVLSDTAGFRATGITFVPTFVAIRNQTLRFAWKGIPTPMQAFLAVHLPFYR